LRNHLKETNLRVLHIIDNNCSGRYFQDLIPGQAEIYGQVGLLTFEPSTRPLWINSSNIFFITGSKANTNLLIKSLCVWRAMRLFSPDVVFTHLPKSATLGAIFCRVFNRQNIYVRHYLDEHWKMNKPWLRLWDILICFTSRNILTMSNETRLWLERKEKVKKDKIRVIAQALNVENLEFDSEIVKAIREEVKEVENSPQPFIGVCVSRFSQGKGQESLVDAVFEFKKQSPLNLVIYFLGTGDSSSLIEHIKALKLERVCKVVGFTSEVLSYIKAADFVVHPSTVDSFSQALMEGLYLGIPVLAVRAGSAEIQIKDGVTGWLIERSTSIELLDGLLLATSDRYKLQLMGIRAKQDVIERFPFEQMLKEYRTLIIDVISKE